LNVFISADETPRKEFFLSDGKYDTINSTMVWSACETNEGGGPAFFTSQEDFDWIATNLTPGEMFEF